MKKKKTIETPAVIIPREHQSAPKEHWADKEIAKAAEEIRTGQFTPTEDPDDFLSIGLQRGLEIANPALVQGAQKLGLLQQTADSMALAQHPRVQEALARLEQEKREAKNSQELAEKAQMLHELNAMASQKDKWDGQGRWIGKENEESRIVNVMSPFLFLARLEKVIGEGRVMLNRFAVAGRVALLSNDRRSLIELPGIPKTEDGLVQVGTLQYPCGPEWMVMRFDEYGVPTKAKYLGWRTALLSMMTLRIITEKEAHKAFPLDHNPASLWYREQLYNLRKEEFTAVNDADKGMLIQ